MTSEQKYDVPPFGTYQPSPLQERFRWLAGRLPERMNKSLVRSLLARLAGDKAGRPFDVTVFGDMKVRLHPYDNVCEKRVYATPQYWDLAERKLLTEHINGAKTDEYVFVDAGANVGLYSLFVESTVRQAGRKPAIISIEPEETVRARFKQNLAFSNGTARIFPCALTDVEKQVHIATGHKNRGENKIEHSAPDQPGTLQLVDGKPLWSLVQEAGVPRVDAMKIDLEGYEEMVLTPFFRDAPRDFFPRLIIIETVNGAPLEEGATGLCLQNGYNVLLRTKMNTVFSLD